VRALEDAILKHARLRPSFKSHYFPTGGDASTQPLLGFEQRLSQADVYLQMLIQQIGELEGRPELAGVVAKGNEFLSAIKHSIVLLQIAKVGSQGGFVIGGDGACTNRTHLPWL